MREWTEWHGGKCPDLEGLRRDLLLRNGEILENENIQDWWDDWNWSGRAHSPNDIVGYREPAE